jgi:superfamily II DNA or RNA helicase
VAIKLESKFPWKNPASGKEAYVEERQSILENVKLNEFVKNWVLKACLGNTLIPVERDFHEDLLYQSLKDCGREVYVVNGNMPQTEREALYEEFEEKKDAIMIAKVGVMKAGTSINSLQFMVGILLGKSFYRVLQLIGRIERKSKDNATPVVYDFYHNRTYSEKHYAERKEFYDNDNLPVTERSVVLDY